MNILRHVAEAPIVIGNRKELTQLLSQAAELEHASCASTSMPPSA